MLITLLRMLITVDGEKNKLQYSLRGFGPLALEATFSMISQKHKDKLQMTKISSFLESLSTICFKAYYLSGNSYVDSWVMILVMNYPTDLD